MKLTREQMDRAFRAKSAGELQKLADEAGTNMPADQVKALFDRLHGEMSDAELANVTGGCGDDDPTERTKMQCASCGMWRTWIGNYQNGVAYECPECKNKTMVGVSFYHQV